MSQGFVRGIVGLFPVFFLLFVANSQQSPAAGIFTTAYLGGNNANPPDLDASIGLSTGKTYLTAVNFNGSAVTINGVPFAASSGGNPSGTDYSTSGIPDTYSGFTSQVSGNLSTLLSSFIYGGSPGEYNFSGLTPGQTYVITYYGVSFDPAGERVQNLTTSDGATGTYDVDMDAPAAGYANLLRYTFQATAATETITATPQVSGYTLHTYGLSMEQTFNNTTSPSGNTNWSALTWSNGTAPNGPDTNAYFSPAAAHTTITLDTPTTLGYLQFAGTNSYLLSGTNTLTMQADVGGTALLNASDGSHTISAPIVLNSTAAQMGGGTLTLNGGVSGTGGLSVSNGVLTLTTSNNTYTGPTTAVTAGTLALLNSNPFPNSTLTMSGGAVVFDSSVSPKVFNIGGLAGTSNLALQDNAASPNPVTLNVGGNGAVTNYTGLLSGAGTLNVVGPGTLVLGIAGAAGNLTGGIRISGGELGVVTGALGTMHPAFAGGALQYAASNTQDYGSLFTNNTFPIALDTNGGTVPVSNIGSTNSGGLTKLGSGLLELSGNNTYSGPTTISGGTLQMGILPGGTGFLPSLTAVNLSSSSAYLNLGATPQTIGSLTGVSAATVLDGVSLTTGNDNTNATFSGMITGTGSLTKIGLGTAVLNGPNGYTGATSVSGGTLAVGPSGSLPATTTLTDNASVSFNNSSQSLFALASSGSVTLNNTALTITGTSTFSGSINGGGSLLASGGSLTLIGNNASAVPTTVNNGTLVLSNAGSNNIAAATPVTVNSLGTLNVSGLGAGNGITLANEQTLRGQGNVLGSVTAGTGSTLLSGTGNTVSTGIGTLTLMGNLNFASGATLATYLGTPGTSSTSPGDGGLINVQGNVTLPSSGLNLSLLTNSNLAGLGSLGNGYYDLINYTGTLTGAPSSAFAPVSGRTFAFYVQNNQLDMYVAIANLNWTGVNSAGAANSSWDTTTTSTNWANLALSSTTANSYQDGSNVTFQDKNVLTGGTIANSNIVIQPGGVQPNALTINNNAVSYTFSDASGGTVGIAGLTGIVKSGSGAVYLQGANSFQGPVTINGGIVNVANSAGLGNSSGVTVASGAALQLQGGVAVPAISLSLAGSGVTGSPGALNSVSGTNSFVGAVTLTGSSTIDATAGLLTLGGAVNNGGYLLTIGGSGTTTMSGPGISGTGGLTVNARATLNLSGSMASSINVIDNGALNLSTAAQSVANFSGSGAGSSLILNNTALTVTGTGVFAGSISGGGSLAISGVQQLTGATALAGGVGVNGTLLVAGTGSVSSANNLGVGYQSAAIGAVFQSGGAVSVTGSGNSLYVGAAGGAGAYNITAGTVTAGAGTTVDIGGLSGSGGTGALNVNGGLVQALGAFTVGNGPTTINLDGGLLQTPAWMGRSNSVALSFNGGTLQANSSGSNYLAATTSSSITVYAGGAVIDTNGNNISILQPLIGEADSGITSVNIGRKSTTVFASPPAVTFTGGSGSGATAYATLSPSGTINGIVVTNPGNYTVIPTSITVTGATGLGLTAGTTSNNIGGLTKNGAGILALAGVNTYGGPTVINAGTLQLATQPGIPSGIQPVALYPMNGPLGAIAAGAGVPESVSGLNGTVNGTGASYVSGNFSQSQALQFSNSSYFTAPYSSALALSTFTYSTWVNFTSQPPVSGSGPVLLSTRNGGNETFDLQYAQPSAGNYYLHADIGTGSAWLNTAANSSTFGALSGWNMVTYVVNSMADTYSIYLNGASVGGGTFSGTALMMTSGENLSIGAQEAGGTSYNSSSGYLNGAVEDAGIYNGAMTPAEVQSLYTTTVGTLPTATPVTLAHGATFDLNGTTQQVASLQDGAGGGGTLTNSSVASATLTLAPPSGTYTFSGTITNGSAPLNLVLNGNFSATQVLSGSNTFTGSATVANMTLVLANSAAMLNATLNATQGCQILFDPAVGTAFSLGGLSGDSSVSIGLSTDSGSNPMALALTVGSNGQNTTYSGTLTDGGGAGASLTKVGSGILTLLGNNTYTGTTFINGGELGMGNGAIPSGGIITFGGGALQYAASNTNDYSAQVFNSTGPVAIDTNGLNVTFATPLDASNTGGLAKLGAGILTLTAANAYSGTTTIAGGELSVGNLAAIPASSTITFTGGALQYTPVNTLDYSAQIHSSTAAIALDTNGLTVTISGVLDATNSSGLTKLGTGTLVLANANAYGGTTTVAGGLLQLANQQGIPDNTGLAVSGGTLDLHGYTNKTLDLLTGSALSGGLITSSAPATAVTLNLAVVPATALESIAGTTLSDGAGTLALNISSTNGSGLQITNTNHYSGGTTINGSYVQMDNPSALGTGAITVSDSGYVALQWNSGSPKLANNWVLNNSAIYATGGTAGYGVSNSGAYNLTGSITLAAGGDIDAASTNILSISGPISGPGGLYKGVLGSGIGGGLVVLTNTANSYQGGTTISDGTLGITADAVLGPTSGGITFAGNGTLESFANSIQINANRAITIPTGVGGTINVQNYSMSILGSINGGGGLTVAGGAGGILALSSANGYLGGTNINGGVLNVNNAAAIPGQIAFGGGTLQYTVNNRQDYSAQIFNSTGPIAIDTNGQTVTFGSGLDVSNTGGLTKIGQGTLILSAYNNYSGTTTIAGGVLNVGSVGAIPATSNITFTGGTLQYTAASQPNDYSGQIVNSTSPIAIDTNGQDVTFASPLAASNVGGLTKIGAGLLTIGAAATYSGPTVVSSGTLQLAAPASLPVVPNGNFANPGFGGANYAYYSLGNGTNTTAEVMTASQATALVWTSSGNAVANRVGAGGALTSQGSGWGYATPYPTSSLYPSSSQAFSLQANSYLGQTLNNLAAGTYTLSWSQAFRPGYADDPYEFLLNGVPVGSAYNNESTAWNTTSATFTITSAGSYTIGFLGTSADDGSFGLTNFAFTNYVPVPAPLSLAASAVFDLNGNSQTISSLSDVNARAGVGSVINSNASVAVVLTISPTGGSTTFSGTISDNGSANAISLVLSGTGTQVMAGSNSYSGTTTIAGGVLQAIDGVGLPGSSSLIFSGSLAQTGAGAVLQSSGAFSRAVGPGAGEVQWTGDGGFAANGGPLTVSIPNGSNPLMWGNSTSSTGTPYFLPDGSVLTFGSPTANNQVNFTNSIDLNGETRQIYVAKGTGGDSALISGNILDSVGGAALLKTGAGDLILSGTDTYTGGTTVAGGILTITAAAALPTGSSLTVGGGGTFIFDPTVATASPVVAAGSAAPASVAAVPEPGVLVLLAAATMVGFGIWRRRG